jgi:putative flippase GtrA
MFLIVGSLTVCIDFLSYHGLLWFSLDYSLAKAAGFIFGTIFAYFANKYWTFRHVEHAPNDMLRFAFLYTVTLGANVIVNQVSIIMAGPEAVNWAFLLATGVSAVLNFLGMRFFVFTISGSRV